MEIIPKQPDIKYGKKEYKTILGPIPEKSDFKYTGVAVKAKRARVSSVISNHFNLKFKKTKVYQFNARFSPELEEGARDKIDEIFRANGRKIRELLGSYVRAVNCVFTFKLPKEGSKLFEFKEHKEYTLELIKTKELDFKELFSVASDRFELFRVLNIQIKQIMKKNKYLEFGIDRKYYDTGATQQLEIMNGEFLLDVMKGYKTVMDVYHNNVPKVLIDCCSRVVRVYDLWQEYNYYKGQGLDDDRILDEFIIGRSFLAYYGNQKIYRVDRVDFDKTPMSKFPNNKFKNFYDYYLKTYNVKIEDTNQFLVVSIRRKKELDKNGKKIVKEEEIHLVPELLKPTGLTDSMRANGGAMRDLAQFTQINPDARDSRQKALAKQLNDTPSELNVEVDVNSNTIDDALIYNPPTIYLEKAVQPEGAGTFRIKEAIHPKNTKLQKWLLICDDRDKKSAQDFALTMLKSSKSLGVTVQKPKIVGIKENNPVKLAAKCITEIETLNPTITLLFFQKRTADKIYARIKTECHVRIGALTQFFVNWRPNDKRSLTNMSIASNIVLQMITKLGNSPWLVQRPTGINDNGSMTMVIGADVFHTGHKDSVASVIATLDKDFTQYYSCNSFQMKRGDDILHYVSNAVVECTRKYAEVNKRAPDNIVFYRDGIGMGQHERVREIEITSIVEELKKSGIKSKLIYIVVTKRINDRFFEYGFDRRTKRKGPINPQGGLIVHSGAVNNNGFDFFMIAQNVNRGTATPVHFEVLFNDTSLSADSLFELTYYQTFNYYNWSGPVKVPSVVQYANKQAYLVGSTKKKRKERYDDQDSEFIREKPYFL